MSEKNIQVNVPRKRKRSSDFESQGMKTPTSSNTEGSQDMSQTSKGLQRYLVAVDYIGTNFAGFQKQPNARTVQGTLEDAFSKFIGQPVSSAGSSRTDAGVHALANVCHVDVQRISKRKPGEVLPPHEPGVVKRAVNHFLQKDAGDMSVVDVRSVPLDFHARFRAQERIYYYRIVSGTEPLSIFEKDRAWHVPEDLNLSLMQEACEVLVGCHDFSSFRAAGCQAKSPIRTVDELFVCEMPTWPAFPSSISRNDRLGIRKANCTHFSLLGKVSPDLSPQTEGNISLSLEHQAQNEMLTTFSEEYHDDHKETELYEFGCRRGYHGYLVKARAQSFLYHQVRLLVGVLKCVGTGELTVENVERILKARTVTAAPPMAPAHGLYLAEVMYDFKSSIQNKLDDDNE